jgi:hypothetical protein
LERRFKISLVDLTLSRGIWKTYPGSGPVKQECNKLWENEDIRKELRI